jgi:hypothetical protein
LLNPRNPIFRARFETWWIEMSVISKRFGVITTVLAGVAIGAFLFATGAQAAPYSTAPAVAASTQVPAEGSSLTLTGSGYLSGETVDNVLHSAPYALQSAVADGLGNFSVSVTLPSGVTGSHTISSTGAISGRVSTIAITIVTPQSSGGLPDTGVAILGIGSVGVTALVVGGLVLLAGRRRRIRV